MSLDLATWVLQSDNCQLYFVLIRTQDVLTYGLYLCSQKVLKCHRINILIYFLRRSIPRSAGHNVATKKF